MTEGITTGSCAALAAKAAALRLFNAISATTVDIPLPDGSRLHWPVAHVDGDAASASATVIKFSGDDPDVTDGARITVTLSRSSATTFHAGEGVGTVTRPGLAVAVGEAAINPVPRQMIRAAIDEVTTAAVAITVAVAGGRELAQKTFNPRLGISGGISIIGTSGRVRPFSAEALRQSLKCALDVCVAAAVTTPLLVPGHMGCRAAARHFNADAPQVVEVSNEWGYILDLAASVPFRAVMVLGHPGKLGKLAAGYWNTHSAHSPAAVEYIAALGRQLDLPALDNANTVEELFMQMLNADQRARLAQQLADNIAAAIVSRCRNAWPLTLVLTNLDGDIIATTGDLQPWQNIR